MIIVIQKTHGNTTTVKVNETGTLQRGGSNVMDKVPNILINEQVHNTIQSGHDTYPENGGGNSLTKKHCWDMVKVIQLNKSKESNGQQPYQQNRIFDAEGISPIIDQSAGKFSIKVKSATKKGFEEAKEGDSINLSVPNSSTRRGRVGNGQAQCLDTQSNQAVCVELRNDEGVREFSEGVCGTLRTTNNCGDKAVINGFKIRRLTEVECERLQGFPDHWTKFGIYEKKVFLNKKEGTFEIVTGVKEISRTQRYKMCGNAVTKHIPELIGRKLLELLQNED